MQRLYAKAAGWAAAGGCSSWDQLTLERRLLGLCRPFLEDPLAVQEKLDGGLSGTSRSCSSSFRTRRLPRITTPRNGACAIW